MVLKWTRKRILLVLGAAILCLAGLVYGLLDEAAIALARNERFRELSALYDYFPQCIMLPVAKECLREAQDRKVMLNTLTCMDFDEPSMKRLLPEFKRLLTSEDTATRRLAMCALWAPGFYDPSLKSQLMDIALNSPFLTNQRGAVTLLIFTEEVDLNLSELERLESTFADLRPILGRKMYRLVGHFEVRKRDLRLKQQRDEATPEETR